MIVGRADVEPIARAVPGDVTAEEQRGLLRGRNGGAEVGVGRRFVGRNARCVVLVRGSVAPTARRHAENMRLTRFRVLSRTAVAGRAHCDRRTAGRNGNALAEMLVVIPSPPRPPNLGAQDAVRASDPAARAVAVGISVIGLSHAAPAAVGLHEHEDLARAGEAPWGGAGGGVVPLVLAVGTDGDHPAVCRETHGGAVLRIVHRPPARAANPAVHRPGRIRRRLTVAEFSFVVRAVGAVEDLDRRKLDAVVIGKRAPAGSGPLVDVGRTDLVHARRADNEGAPVGRDGNRRAVERIGAGGAGGWSMPAIVAELGLVGNETGGAHDPVIGIDGAVIDFVDPNGPNVAQAAVGMPIPGRADEDPGRDTVFLPDGDAGPDREPPRTGGSGEVRAEFQADSVEQGHRRCIDHPNDDVVRSLTIGRGECSPVERFGLEEAAVVTEGKLAG